MNSKIITASLALSLLLFAQCKKDKGANPEADNSSFLNSNAKTKVLFTHRFENDGQIHGYTSTRISAQDDGNVSWIFARSANMSSSIDLYRKKIDGNTGTVLEADGDLSKITHPELYAAGTTSEAAILFVQGTDKMYQSTLNSAQGDIPTFGVSDITLTAYPRIMRNGDAIVSSNPHPINIAFSTFTAQMWAHYKTGGVTKTVQTQHTTGNNPDEWWHGGMVYPSGGGQLSAFTYSRFKAWLIDMEHSEETSVAYHDSIPFNAPVLNGPVFTVQYFTKASPDNAQTTILVQECAQLTMDVYYSTFVINNLTHKITKVVEKATLPNAVQGGNAIDFDEAGNIYYIRMEGGSTNKTGIVRRSATGATDLRTDFLKPGAEAYEIAISKSGRIFLAITSQWVEGNNKGMAFNLCVLE